MFPFPLNVPIENSTLYLFPIPLTYNTYPAALKNLRKPTPHWQAAPSDFLSYQAASPSIPNLAGSLTLPSVIFSIIISVISLTPYLAVKSPKK